MDNKRIIVIKAREWIGTKFLHRGRLKKDINHDGGCDCLGLVIGVLKELNIDINFMDDIFYRPIIRTNILVDNIEKYLNKKDQNNPEEGDIALFRLGKVDDKLPPQHLGIINVMNENFTLIHTHAKIGKVVEHLLDNEWKGKICGLFTINL